MKTPQEAKMLPSEKELAEAREFLNFAGKFSDEQGRFSKLQELPVKNCLSCNSALYC